MRIADHEGDGHGFAERAPEPEHDAAGHTHLGVGQHHLPHHFPGGRADRIGGFLEHRRHHVKDVAHHRSDERDHHDRENDAGRQQADPHGRAGKERADQGECADMPVQPGLDVVGEHRRKHEQSPHPVNDAGNAGQQFDRDAERAAQKARRKLGQEQRDTETDRNRDEQRDTGSDQRAEHRDQRAKVIVDRVPFGAGQEAKAESVDGGHAALHQRNDDCNQQRQHSECA